jgi:hypothetical protein
VAAQSTTEVDVKDVATAVLRDCLAQDFDSARLRLRTLDVGDLRELQVAAMALQNLAAARRYMLAQQAVPIAQSKTQRKKAAE